MDIEDLAELYTLKSQKWVAGIIVMVIIAFHFGLA